MLNPVNSALARSNFAKLACKVVDDTQLGLLKSSSFEVCPGKQPVLSCWWSVHSYILGCEVVEESSLDMLVQTQGRDDGSNRTGHRLPSSFLGRNEMHISKHLLITQRA